jgi:hypothetical protein
MDRKDYFRIFFLDKSIHVGWSIAFLASWVVLIKALLFFYPLLLITTLEIIFSMDGVISEPDLVLRQVMVAPFVVMSIILANRKILNNWRPLIHNYQWYLTILFLHFALYTIYYRLISETAPVENDIFEIMTFAFAFCAGVLFLVSGLMRVRVAFFIGICFLIFAFEEISWGQSLLGFDSPEFFVMNNYQQEMNLHNFLNPIFPLAYVVFNLLLLSLLTWFSQIKKLSVFYESPSVSFVVRVSNYYSLWMVPTFLSFASVYPGHEFVEQQWSIFGLCFSVLLLVEIFRSRL